MPGPADAIGVYIRAKDGNRPHLMRRAFAEAAALDIVVNTDSISFPASATGLDAITDILVRRFSHDFENVYTFCLASPPTPDGRRFVCDWLVGMTAKADGEIRVGCGSYDWHFRAGDRCLVERLQITIERMQVLPADGLDAITSWLSDLPYPWCPPEQATKSMPKLQGLWEITDYIVRHR